MTVRSRGAMTGALALALLAVAGIAATGAFAGKGLKTSEASTSIGPSPDTGTAKAQCKKKAKAVSGGWSSTLDTDGPIPSGISPLESRRDGKRAWTGEAVSLADSDTQYSVFAYCGKQKIKTKTGETTAPARSGDPEQVTAAAKCKRGTKAVSGGFEGEFNLDMPGTTLILIGESRRASKREWSVTGGNLGDQAGTLTAQVNCRKGKKKVKERTAEHTFPDDAREAAQLTAKCRKKERVVSGGFSLDEPNDGVNAILLLSTFQKQGRRSWFAEAVGRGAPGITPTLTISAYCEKKKPKKK